ncbi:MAG: hypothetical protein AAFN93_09005, partial [Bacteroidota bacterium]
PYRRYYSLPPQRIMPYIETWTLKETTSGAPVECRSFTLAEENSIADMETAVVLKGETSYTQKITLKAIEYFFDAPERPLDWEESKEEIFRTGTAPNHIVDDNVVFTYPFKNQNYFLKGETQGGMGYVQLDKAEVETFRTHNSEFREHDYVARFFKLGTDETFDVPLQLSNARTTVSFDISQLENDQHYTVQLLKIENVFEQEEEEEAGDNSIISENIGDVSNVDPSVSEALRQRTSERFQNLISSDLGSLQLRRRSLPGPTVRNPREQVLFYYHFKTDVHDTFIEKVNNTSITKEYGRWRNLESFVFSLDENAKFDWLDGRGYRKPTGEKIFDPLVNVTYHTGGEFSPYTYPINYYHRERVIKKILTPTTTLTNIVRAHYLPEFRWPYTMQYEDFVRFTSDSPFRAPLTEGELNRANNPPPERSPIDRVTADFGSGSRFSIPGPTLPVSLPAPEPVKVIHFLSVPGISNFTNVKSRIAGYLTQTFSVGYRDVISNPDFRRPEHYYQQYKTRYGDDIRVSGRTVIDYLSRFHPQKYAVLLGMIFTPTSGMLYPETTYGNNQHSYILQYQYPAPNRLPRLVQGTHKRITFSHQDN